MYKNLEQLGITPVKCQNKNGTEKIKELHYKLNDLLFKYRYTFLSPKMALWLVKSISGLSEELKGLSGTTPASAQEKLSEVKKGASDAISKLNAYYSQVENDEMTNSKVIKKRVGEYIKEKDALTFDKALELAKENWLFAKAYPCSVPSFNKEQDEIISFLKDNIDKLSI